MRPFFRVPKTVEITETTETEKISILKINNLQECVKIIVISSAE